MKVVKILGGLGNQMFQYALALALGQRYPDDIIKIDVSCFKHYNLHNGYELDRIFGAKFVKATPSDLIKVAYPYFNYRIWQIASRILPERKTMITQHFDKRYEPTVFSEDKYYFDGYWQSEMYFADIRDIILSTFSFQLFNEVENIELQRIIENSVTASIHIRRGDYLNTPMYRGICTLEYYKNAIRYLKANTHIDCFVIFSNDVEWCKQNANDLFGNNKVIYVDWNTKESSYRDMQLMSLCHHNIVANSSFSWWGAWLNGNPNKMVIAPDKWINGNLNLDTIPDSWIKI